MKVFKRITVVMVLCVVLAGLILTAQAFLGRRKLLSIGWGGGFGTIEETAGMDITVYTNGTIYIREGMMPKPGFCRTKISKEDYQKLEQIARPKQMADVEDQEEMDVSDGSSSYIYLYDENNEVLVDKGGYMVFSEDYWETYDRIMDILELYMT